MRHFKQSGFTLIEIVIVIMILGLMIAMAAKANELINISTVKVLAGEFNEIQCSLNGYQDKFHALPGDDHKASAHLPVTGATIDNGNGNSVINGNWNSTTGESYNLWQHVRLAGLFHGTTDTSSNDYIPHNAKGGTIGVTGAHDSPIPGLKGEYVICSDNIAGKLAKQLDLSMDDGNTDFGMMRVSNAYNGGSAVAYKDIIDDSYYLVCLGV